MTARAAPFVDRHFGTIVAMAASLFGGYMAGQTEQKDKIESLQNAVTEIRTLVNRDGADIAELRHLMDDRGNGK